MRKIISFEFEIIDKEEASLIGEQKVSKKPSHYFGISILQSFWDSVFPAKPPYAVYTCNGKTYTCQNLQSVITLLEERVRHNLETEWQCNEGIKLCDHVLKNEKNTSESTLYFLKKIRFYKNFFNQKKNEMIRAEYF